MIVLSPVSESRSEILSFKADGRARRQRWRFVGRRLSKAGELTRLVVVGLSLLCVMVAANPSAAACTISGKKVTWPKLQVPVRGEAAVQLDLRAWPLSARFRSRSRRVKLISRGSIRFKTRVRLTDVPLGLVSARSYYGGVLRLGVQAKLEPLKVRRHRITARVTFGPQVSVTMALPCRHLTLDVPAPSEAEEVIPSGPALRSKAKTLWLRAGRRKGPRMRVHLTTPAAVPFEVLARAGSLVRIRARFVDGHALVGWTSATALSVYRPTAPPVPRYASSAKPSCSFWISHYHLGEAIVSAGTLIRTSPSRRGAVWGHVGRAARVQVFFAYDSDWVRILYDAEGPTDEEGTWFPGRCDADGGRAWVPRSAVSLVVTAPSTP